MPTRGLRGAKLNTPWPYEILLKHASCSVYCVRAMRFEFSISSRTDDAQCKWGRDVGRSLAAPRPRSLPDRRVCE